MVHLCIVCGVVYGAVVVEPRAPVYCFSTMLTVQLDSLAARDCTVSALNMTACLAVFILLLLLLLCCVTRSLFVVVSELLKFTLVNFLSDEISVVFGD